jgi:hypothetical protein
MPLAVFDHEGILETGEQRAERKLVFTRCRRGEEGPWGSVLDDSLDNSIQDRHHQCPHVLILHLPSLSKMKRGTERLSNQLKVPSGKAEFV